MAAVAAACLLVSGSAGGAGPDGSIGRALADFLLDELRDMNGVPGMSAAVAVRGEIVWTGTSGWADVEAARPVRDGTAFRIASVSKLLAAALALRLSEEGLLRPRDPILGYFAGLPDAFEGVTLAHLAAHAGGIAHYTAADRRIEGKHYDTLVEAMPAYVDRTPVAAPGEAYHYSSWSYALLGAAIEKAAGKPFAQSLRERVLEPLDLAHTWVESPEDPGCDASRLYALTAAGATERLAQNDQSYALGGTGIRSTAADLVRFSDAYLHGRLVAPETRDFSWTPFRLNDGRTAAGEGRYEVGFGWRIGADWDGRRVVHHSGITPGARSILLAWPGERMSVSLLSNAIWTSRIETTAELLAAPFVEPRVPGADACPAGDWNYLGSFRTPDAASAPAHAQGRLEIRFDGELCTGRLVPAGALSTWMKDQSARREWLALAAVARRRDALVFALVTPWGLSPLRAERDRHGTLGVVADIAGRELRLAATRVARDSRPAQTPDS